MAANSLNSSASSRQTQLLLLLAIALLVGVGVLWLRQQSQSTVTAENLPPELRDEPDLFINDAVIHQFHTDGNRKYLLKAKTVNHFERQALTEMEQPDLLLEGRDEPWHATSDQGQVRKQLAPKPALGGTTEEVVLLRQNVELSQTRKPPRYLSIRTTSLDLYPDREYVETDESVTIDTHTGRTKASSMSGDLDTGVLRLTGDIKQVQTIVLPFQFK